MGHVSGRKSDSEFNREQYRRSWRAKRREAFVAQRDAVRSAAPPPLLGPRTDILTVLAACGPVRMACLMELFSEMRVTQARTGTDGGICIGWKLPGSDKRGQRGAALALDPLHPLHKETRELLLALAEEFPFRARQDMTEAELALPSEPREYDVEKIFFSRNRLRVLSAFEVLGAEARVSDLSGSVPGMRPAVVVPTVLHLVKEGLLAKDGPFVSFPQARWTGPLRALLRAYLKLHPGLPNRIRSARAEKQKSQDVASRNTLIGRNVVQRALTAMAAYGPIRTSELDVRAKMNHAPHDLRKMIRDGIVARVCVGTGKERHFVLSLNAAHPLYGELRTLLCSMAKLEPSAKTPLSSPVPRFNIEALFTGPVIASVLLALETAVHGEIDPSSVFRLYPQHDQARISQLLGEWWEQGLVSGHHFGNIVLYRFDPDYPHYKPLRAFLRKIVECEPRYAAIAKLEPALYVSSRQRTAHARRRKETAQGQ